MNGLNKAYFIGHLGRDPEPRTTPGGTTLVRLSLATPHARKDGENWVDTPDWHRLTAFGKTAESLLRNAHKGDMIAVESVIRPNRWTDKDGKTHYEVNLYVERVLWISQKRRATAAVATDVGPEIPVGAAAAQEDDESEEVALSSGDGAGEDEIPF
ncbi:MAG: single-stranded DNA-binding protein [Myxococcales bacterium]|nr:single-stranded DNA-binding protein [Myxococcales bacterium]